MPFVNGRKGLLYYEKIMIVLYNSNRKVCNVLHIAANHNQCIARTGIDRKELVCFIWKFSVVFMKETTIRFGTWHCFS